MRIFVLATVLLLAVDPAMAATRRADPDYLATIRDDDPNPLPRNLAPHEIGVPLPQRPNQPSAPPSGPVRAQAEYEANQGILIRWGSYNASACTMDGLSGKHASNGVTTPAKLV